MKMSGRDARLFAEPPRVSILRDGPYLIASVHTALDDAQLVRFQADLVERIQRERSRGVIVDVAAMDVVDSFTSRTLSNVARMAQLRGAATVIVGISPELAITMVQLGMTLDPVKTALDLDEGLACLDVLTGGERTPPVARRAARG
jgi:rsbT antagonist protein RsbS